METKVSSTKSSGTKRSSAKSSRAKNKSQNDQLTKQESENEKDWMMEDLKGEQSNESQEYINAEMENKRFNKKLGMNGRASSGKATVKTSRIKTEKNNGKKLSRDKSGSKRSDVDRERALDETENSTASRRSNGERLMRSKSRTTSENEWIKERNGSHRRWRNRSTRYRVYNRNYERGFKDGYRAAMEELRSNSIPKRRKTDGEFRYNERRNVAAKKSSNGQVRNERMNGHNHQEFNRSNRDEMNFPPVSQSVREKAVNAVRGSRKRLSERIHFEEHPTGRFFIEHFTGGSTPHNEHLENMHYRTKIDSLMHKRGRKVVH